MRKKIIFASSGGKDSVLAIAALQKGARYDIVALLTTITKNYNRVSMHGVRTYFLEQQAHALGFPFETILKVEDRNELIWKVMDYFEK